jgi:hypothetical protein
MKNNSPERLLEIMRKVSGLPLNENNNVVDTRYKNKAIIIASKIYKTVHNIINNEIDDKLHYEMFGNADVFFKFYEILFDTLMNKYYENYADTFNKAAGAAPDEFPDQY